MTFQPDTIISWDVSKNDNPTIVITEIKYDSKIKNLIGNVLAVIDARGSGAISINQVIAQNHLRKYREQKTLESFKESQAIKKTEEKQDYIRIPIDCFNAFCNESSSVAEVRKKLLRYQSIEDRKQEGESW